MQLSLLSLSPVLPFGSILLCPGLLVSAAFVLFLSGCSALVFSLFYFAISAAISLCLVLLFVSAAFVLFLSGCSGFMPSFFVCSESLHHPLIIK